MPPSHNQSTADANSQDATPSTDTAGSGNAAAPTKPSLRILHSGPATREEDLSYGPLLRGIGADIHEYEAISSLAPSSPDQVLADLHERQASRGSVLPEMALGIPSAVAPPTESQSQVTDTGPTYSVPIDGQSQSVSHNREPGLFMLPIDDQSQAASYNGEPGLFLRQYEFSWENSRLLFAGKPFDLVRASGIRSSEAGPESRPMSPTRTEPYPEPQAHGFDEGEPQDLLLGMQPFDAGGSAETLAVSGLAPDLEIATSSSVSSVDSQVHEDDNTEAALSPHAIIAREKAVDWIVEMLCDDFLRSYALQKPRKQSSAARNQDANRTRQNSGQRKGRSNGSTQPAGGSRRRKAMGSSGEDEDEDGDPGDEQQRASSAARSRSTSARFICPFRRWRPHQYKCVPKSKQISHLKGHLKKRHYVVYCHRCYRVFKDGIPKGHSCSERAIPPGVMTDERLEEITKRVDKTKSHHEQWQTIYKVLFPNDPRRPNPILEDDATENARTVEAYYESERTQALLDNLAKKRGYTGRAAVQRFLDVCSILPEVLADFMSDGRASPFGDSQDEQADQDQMDGSSIPSQALDPGPTPLSLQHPAEPTAAILTPPVLGLDGDLALMPSALDGWQISQGIDGLATLNDAGMGHLGLAGFDDAGLDVPSTSFDPAADDMEFSPFTHLEGAAYEAYEPRNTDASPLWETWLNS
ncbi:hypothetical protein ACJ41O_014536 [Fusarium nematophilum]